MIPPRPQVWRLLAPAWLLALLALGMGCLEPGDTPLGAEYSPAPLPDDAAVYAARGAALNLRVTRIEESHPLFDTEVLACGADSASGFRAEPVFRFDCGAFTPYVAGIETARLAPTFPDAGGDSLWAGDNPDLGRDVAVSVWRLPDMDFENVVLDQAVRDIPGAWPVTGVVDTLLSAATLSLPPESLEVWIAAGDTVNLALAYEDALSEPGLVRLISRRSSATATTLQIESVSVNEDPQSLEPFDDGNAATKDDTGAAFTDRLVLATGVTRDALLQFDLPDSLRDPDIILVRAVLQLWPDDGSLVGLSPGDRADNDVGGFALDEGGLTVKIQAVDDSLPGSAGFDEGRVLEQRLALFTAADDPAETDPPTVIAAPLALPLTTWLQDWANGDDENHGVTLRLNGATERLRQVAYLLDPADAELSPRLELLYLRRPDFD